MSILGKNLAYLSKIFAMSYREMSRKTGVLPSTLTRIVNDGIFPRQKTIEAIGKAFNLDPWKLQTEEIDNMALPFIDNGSIRQAPQDAPSEHFIDNGVRAATSDLNSHERLSKLQELLNRTPGNDYITAIMPSDELDPVVPRGAILFLTVETDQFNPDTASSDEAIGVIGETEDGKGAIAFGKLVMIQGKPYIAPTNPVMKGQIIEVRRVPARVAGWAVYHRK